jgi:hypothetical protein
VTGTALTPAAPVPPPIPDTLDAVLRRMRFPYLRKDDMHRLHRSG